MKHFNWLVIIMLVLLSLNTASCSDDAETEYLVVNYDQCVTDNDCDDGDENTKDLCLPDSSCWHLDLSGTSTTEIKKCESGCSTPPENYCDETALVVYSENGVCVDGECEYLFMMITDADSCQPETLEPECSEEKKCDDGVYCTKDECVDGICVFTPITDCCVSNQECDDGDECTYNKCLSGTCNYNPIPNCGVDALSITLMFDSPDASSVCFPTTNKKFTTLTLESGPDFIEVTKLTISAKGLFNTDDIKNITVITTYGTWGTVEKLNDEGKAVFYPKDIPANELYMKMFIMADVVNGPGNNIALGIESADDIETTIPVIGEFPLYGDFVGITGVCDECTQDTDCDDNNNCTDNICTITNKCLFVTIPDCCLSNTDCDDDDECTDDICTLTNKCLFIPIPECEDANDECAIDTDCDDGDECTTDSCVDNECLFTAIPECCISDTECDDSDDCTDDICTVSHQCLLIPVPGCGTSENPECTTHDDCKDYDDCTNDLCIDNKCFNMKIPDCECEDDNDCGSPTSSEFEYECFNHTCYKTPKYDIECFEDYECANIYGAPKCSEPYCIDNICKYKEIENCVSCNQDSQCNDFNICTTDICNWNNVCVFIFDENCVCDADIQCDDNNSCTNDYCINNTCVNTAIDDCYPCDSDADCNDNKDYTTDICNSENQCSFIVTSSECEKDEDCEQGICSQINQKCIIPCGPALGFPDCSQGTTCFWIYDSPDGEDFDEWACLPIVCSTDADCDDNDPSTEETCVDSECVYSEQ